MLTRQRLRLLAAVWIAGLVAVSLQPWRPHGEPQSIVHNLWHVVFFGAPAIMLFALSQNAKQAWSAALGIFCLAVAIETTQHLFHTNPFEWWDIRDDTIGLALAAVLIRWTRIRSLLLQADD